MYNFGQQEGFPTPTTGTDHSGCALPKAPRVLFAQTPDSRSRRSLQEPQQHGCLALAEQNSACSQPYSSELTEEDLQDLWKLTSAVPFFADVQLAVQPSGYESEVQQQQLLCLAHLLQGGAVRSHALQPQTQAPPPLPLDKTQQVCLERVSRSGITVGLEHSISRHGASSSSSSRDVSMGQQAHSHGPCFGAAPQLRPIPHRLVDTHTHQPEIHTDQTHQAAWPAHLHEAPQGHLNDTYQRSQMNVGLRHHPAMLEGALDCSAHSLENSDGCQGPAMYGLVSGAQRLPATHNHQGQHTALLHADASHFCHLGSSTCGLGAINDCDPDQMLAQKPPFIAPPTMSLHTSQLNPHMTHSHRKSIPCPKAPVSPQDASAAQQDRSQGFDRARVSQESAHQARPLQPARTAPQCSQQGRAVAQGLQQARASQQVRAVAKRVQLARAAPPGRASASDPSPARASSRLGQKRKQAALLANISATDTNHQAPAAASAHAVAVNVSKSGVQALRRKASPLAVWPCSEPGGVTELPQLSAAVREASAAPNLVHMNPADPLGGAMLPPASKSQSPSDDFMLLSQPSHGEMNVESSMADFDEVDLLADPSDALGLSPDRPEMCDDLPGYVDHLPGFQDDLQAEPMEGLAVPCWYDLLDEEASQLTPQGLPMTCPALTDRHAPGFFRTSPPLIERPAQGLHATSPALTDSNAQTQQRFVDASMTWDSGRSAGWNLNECSSQNGFNEAQHSAAADKHLSMQFSEDASGHAQQLRQSQFSRDSTPTLEAMFTDAPTQDRDHTQSIQTESACIEAGKHAAVQKPKGVAAKRAKRGATSRRGQGRKQDQSQGQGEEQDQIPGQGRAQGQQQPEGQSQGQLATAEHVAVAGQGQTAQPEQGQKLHMASLAKLLPFDNLKGRVRDSDLAELNSRIQATAFQPAAIKQQPITCKAAPAMPICPLGDKAVQNSARDGSTSPLALMESNGFLLLQSASAAGRDLETDGVLGAGGISIPGAWGGCHKAMNGKPAGGGSVQLVKLTGTTNVGLRA